MAARLRHLNQGAMAHFGQTLNHYDDKKGERGQVGGGQVGKVKGAGFMKAESVDVSGCFFKFWLYLKASYLFCFLSKSKF